MARTWDPIRDMDRFVGQMFSTPRSVGMPADLYRDGEDYKLSIDLPGVDPATIDISVEDRVLTVSAERKVAAPDGAEWLVRERPAGTFARQISLGQGLALDKITADYADGVLVMTIPVAEESKPRKIEVTRSGGSATIEAETK